MKNRLMKWRAVCGESVYMEQHNAFKSIEKDKLDYFYLEGLDTTFKHDVKTGQFSINDNHMIFLLNDKLIGKSNNVINYKEKIFNVTGPRNNDIVGYYTGWKEKTKDFDYIEVLYWIDMTEQKIKIRFRATPNNNSVLSSIFTFVMNGIIVNQEIEFEEVNERKEFVFEIFE